MPGRVSLEPPVPSPGRGILLRVALASVLVAPAIALASGLVGAQLASRAASQGLTQRAETLAQLTAARLEYVPASQRGALVRRVSEHGGALLTVVDPTGFSVQDAPASPVPARSPLLRENRAIADVTFDVQPYRVATRATQYDGIRHVVIAAVPVPTHPGRVPQLLAELLTVLTAIGALGVAAALVVARDITTDVRAIGHRASQMATNQATALEPLPVRAFDEVGALVEAFNALQQRFAEELDAHRAALARLEDAERRKEVLIATLRHELRTPLNSVIGFADLLLSGVDGELSPEQREDVEVIARSGRHLLHLVDDVLDLSALASGRFAIDPEPVDLVPLVHEIAREAEGSARRRKVEVRVETPANVLVDGDATSLRRAITNLVQNAIEHAGGRVTIELSVSGRFAAVSVKDNGPGIRPQEIKRLFKPFERGRTGDPSRGNTGLGLAITVALLELHGGTLGAESEPGVGSTFIARLPLRPEALAQAGFA